MRGRERVLAPRRATMLSDATYLCPLLFLFPSSRCSSFPSFPYFPPFDFSFCHACLLHPSCAFHPLVFPIPCCIVNVSLTFSPVHPLFASCLCLGVSVVCFHPILLFSPNNRQSTYTPGSFRVLLAKFFFLLFPFFFFLPATACVKSASNREAVARIRARVLCVFASWLRAKEKRNADKMRIRGGINGERKSNLTNRFFFVRF